jgi:hypothetical protein
LITLDVPPDELLVSVSWPLAAPAAVGSNWTVSVAVVFGLIVRGKLPPETVKPDPVIAAALTVTAALPVEDSVSVCVVGVFTFVLPKLSVVALSPRVPAVALSLRLKFFELLPVLAVSVAVCALATAATFAEKEVLDAPAGTATETGTVTAALSLARVKVWPVVPAAAFSVAVQLSNPAPTIELFAQDKLLSAGTAFAFNLTACEFPFVSLV